MIILWNVWYRRIQRTRIWREDSNIGAGGQAFAGKAALVARNLNLDWGLLFVGAIYRKFDGHLITHWQSGQFNCFIWMLASFIERIEGRSNIGQLDSAGVAQGDKGIRHLTHPMGDINAGIAAQHAYRDGGTAGRTC